ncbi:unnamed protein product [Mytilus coruscus]|uniref:Reverse transcriptase domain-containing protein n=1 Tax=Mytilus coruscus TaxID=42192 RepID=A0A6J8ADG0_MYTCO|nr:unnamed protein product [Mytilus coruscus]
MYLDKLIKRSDIILLQEHWLYSHEKDNIYNNCIDFYCHIKCFDDGIIDDVVDRKRAHAGVAICVNNKYSPYMEKLPDGGDRIAAICSNNYSRDDYLAVLDELIEIVTKYRDSANILIGGDMNASIFRNHPRDNDFKNFIHNNNLRIPDNCVECSTFYHFNNRDESQIDYFIQNFDFINTYCTYSRESAYTSTHDPIMVSVFIKLQIYQMLSQKKKEVKGFTQGEIPLVAALILTELHTEAKENGDPLVIALTDAKSAFDVVSHDGLLREMNKAGLCGDNWLLFKDWYKGLNSNIKWQGQTSRTFLESQGVRQGGVWSPTAYKIFINSLLTTLETYRIGSHIGSIYVGVPSVADYIENFESWKACIKFDFAIIIFHISFEVSCTGYLSLSHLLCGPVCFYVNIFRSCLYPLIHYV